MADPRISPEPLIEVRGLKKYFPIKKGILGRVVGNVQAVDGLDFDVMPQETVGLVGESGCGKTTAGRSLLRLIEPTAGSAMYKGVDLFKLPEVEMRRYRRDLQIIFQDPFSSLNPRMTVENLVGEALRVHGVVQPAEVRETVQALLERVGLQASYVSRYPHEFSGGQRQRIGIARALALKPEFIVCDEAVSALDVSVQAQVINLLQELQEEFQLAYLFIAHDLSVVRHISDRVAVMYLGKIVEIAGCDELYSHPAHPYPQALLSAIPESDPRRDKQRIILRGDVPTPINPPSGCRFHTRCPAAYGRCKTEAPVLKEVAAGHHVACHLYTEPSRSGLTLGQAWPEVSELVKVGAEVRSTKRKRKPRPGMQEAPKAAERNAPQKATELETAPAVAADNAPAPVAPEPVQVPTRANEDSFDEPEALTEATLRESNQHRAIASPSTQTVAGMPAVALTDDDTVTLPDGTVTPRVEQTPLSDDDGWES